MDRPVYCWNCGAQNPAKSQFCDQCSAPLATPGILGPAVRPADDGGAAGRPPASTAPPFNPAPVSIAATPAPVPARETPDAPATAGAGPAAPPPVAKEPA